MWLGQNALYVSTYAADLLAYDDAFGGVFLGVALPAFGIGLLLPRVLL